MSYEHQVSVLNKVKIYHANALSKGMRRRQQMHEAIEAGIDIENDRTLWLKDSVVRIFKLLEECARDFNNENLEERCSNYDLADVLSSALATLHKSTNN